MIFWSLNLLSRQQKWRGELLISASITQMKQFQYFCQKRFLCFKSPARMPAEPIFEMSNLSGISPVLLLLSINISVSTFLTYLYRNFITFLVQIKIYQRVKNKKSIKRICTGNLSILQVILIQVTYSSIPTQEWLRISILITDVRQITSK